SHVDLLETQTAILATIGPDGFPQVTALWFLHDADDLVKLSLNTRRQKVKNLRAHPTCTLFILDPANPYRTLEIPAPAELSADDRDPCLVPNRTLRAMSFIRVESGPGRTLSSATSLIKAKCRARKSVRDARISSIAPLGTACPSALLGHHTHHQDTSRTHRRA